MENREEITSNKEIHYSGLTILSVALGPLSFLALQNLQVPIWISFTAFFGFCLLGFFFQSLRRKETRRLRKLITAKRFRYQVGDEVQYQGRDGFVVMKYGFNHYYLRDIQKDQIILVKRTRLEYDQGHDLSLRQRQSSAERSL